MEINIKKASEQFKIPRSTIYRALKSGKLSRSHSGKLEVAEFLRVFGEVSQSVPRETPNTHSETIENNSLYKAQLEKIQLLEDGLKQAQEREAWQRGQIEKLTDTIKLLEAPKKQAEKRAWWQFWK